MLASMSKHDHQESCTAERSSNTCTLRDQLLHDCWSSNLARWVQVPGTVGTGKERSVGEEEVKRRGVKEEAKYPNSPWLRWLK